jgi:uracil-DNA glycosylase family 4
MRADKSLEQQVLEHLKLYKELGVRWTRPPEERKKPLSRNSGEPAARNVPAPGSSSAGITHKTTVYQSMFDQETSTQESLDVIRTDLGNCERCKLSPTRANIVFGSGNPHAELMFVGEAPGADEDEQGLPFVGRAGQLLTKIIEAIGMSREEVYICNILKCRPPGNRNPEADEIASCESFLFRQIASVRPRVICALGAFGAQTLLRTTESIGRLRGRLIDYRGAKLMATFHPAYLLRNPMEKRKVWEDMQIVRDYLRSLHASNAGPPRDA